jgi:hypothetical protein
MANVYNAQGLIKRNPDPSQQPTEPKYTDAMQQQHDAEYNSIQDQQVNNAATDYTMQKSFMDKLYGDSLAKQNITTQNQLNNADFGQVAAQNAFTQAIKNASAERLANLSKSNDEFRKIIDANIARARNAGVYNGGMIGGLQDRPVGALLAARNAAQSTYDTKTGEAVNTYDLAVKKADTLRNYLSELNKVNIDTLSDKQQEEHYNLVKNLRNSLLSVQKEILAEADKNAKKNQPSYFDETQPSGNNFYLKPEMQTGQAQLPNQQQLIQSAQNAWNSIKNGKLPPAQQFKQGVANLFGLSKETPTGKVISDNPRVQQFIQYAQNMKDQGIDPNTAKTLFYNALSQAGTQVSPQDSIVAEQIFKSAYPEYTGKTEKDQTLTDEVRTAMQKIDSGDPKNALDVYNKMRQEYPDKAPVVANYIKTKLANEAINQLPSLTSDQQVDMIKKIGATIRAVDPQVNIKTTNSAGVETSYITKLADALSDASGTLKSDKIIKWLNGQQ